MYALGPRKARGRVEFGKQAHGPTVKGLGFRVQVQRITVIYIYIL